jgi:hypothetical protein
MEGKTIVGAQVLDAAGEVLGKVTRQNKGSFLVEQNGLVRQAIVVLDDEVAWMEGGEIRLRLERSEMQQRADRPSPDVETPFGQDQAKS